MNDFPKTLPTIRVYRSFDGERYTFMEFAEIDPGHDVAWGELRVMGRDEAERLGRDFVLESLRDYSQRDGNDRTRRLKLRAQALHGRHNDVITVRALPTGWLEIIPHRWTGNNYERLDELSSTMRADTPSRDFIAALERALASVQAPKS